MCNRDTTVLEDVLDILLSIIQCIFLPDSQLHGHLSQVYRDLMLTRAKAAVKVGNPSYQNGTRAIQR